MDIVALASLGAPALVWLIGLEWRMKNLTSMVDVEVSNLQRDVSEVKADVKMLVGHLIDHPDH